ncbi:MAG: hypothetical protein KKA16_12385 [Alphaproteobacteria bacterium]|nr:hypothetical protein [Alphaproteobacteria bacterium]
MRDFSWTTRSAWLSLALANPGHRMSPTRIGSCVGNPAFVGNAQMVTLIEAVTPDLRITLRNSVDQGDCRHNGGSKSV